MLLVVNAGSSSIKLAVFDGGLERVVSGSVAGIGGHARLSFGGRKMETAVADHPAALALLLAELEQAGLPLTALRAAAHRVVHGGAALTAPARLTPDVLDGIRACIPLAPLHNPHNLSAIEALAARAPDLPQFASFDTAFHATNPEVATTYALPSDWRAKGIRRYGFHGLSYAALVASFGGRLPERLLAFHLGNGASLCAILRGESVATSMGYSPTSGLPMGTRTGEIDPMVVLRIAEDTSVDEAARILNQGSGLKALAGDNDMAALLGRDDADARFAVEHFCYWAARHAGSAIVAMGGLDAIAFTGGIGENAASVRTGILSRLAAFGEVPVHVIPADEERQIASEARALLDSGQ